MVGIFPTLILVDDKGKDILTQLNNCTDYR